MAEFLLAVCAAWCMYWVVTLHDSFQRLLALTSEQSTREAQFLARHVNVPLPGGASPHGDASRITRTSEPSPLVAGGPLVTSPPPFPTVAEPASNVVSLDAWVTRHA